MTYELAKELKDAGLILEGDSLPTLIELIEACGVAFSELNKMTHSTAEQKWAATSFSCDECGIVKVMDGFGPTPEEAVAKLWLALNAKQ